MGETKKDDSFHDRPLRWIANPFGPSAQDEEASISTSIPIQYPINPKSEHKHIAVATELEIGSLRDHNASRPALILQYREATGPSELFYDLFFAAAFGSFTDSRQISYTNALTGYIGFFCILWITWMNVALFDVRLARDSVCDRIAKAGQFIVMAGFALVGTFYNVSGFDDPGATAFFEEQARPLSLMIMLSRFILAIQYLSILFFAPRSRANWTPLIAIAACYVFTGCICLGISFFLPYHNQTGYDSYIAWFVLAAFEILVQIAVSVHNYNIMKLKDTHLVERMSLLTLIVLGEGVIVLFNSVTTAFQAGTSLGLLVPPTLAAVLLLYFMYMNYFDNLPNSGFNNRVEAVWAALHFPLHLAIVISAVGARFLFAFSLATQSLSAPEYPTNSPLLQLLIQFPGSGCYAMTNITAENNNMTVVVQGYNRYDDYKEVSPDYDYGYGAVNTKAPPQEPNNTECSNKTILQVQKYINHEYTNLTVSVSELLKDVDDATVTSNMQSWLRAISHAGESMANLHIGSTAALQLYENVANITFMAYELDPPEVEHDAEDHLTDRKVQPPVVVFMKALVALFNFVYSYFMIASGCYLLVLGAMIFLSGGKREMANENSTLPTNVQAAKPAKTKSDDDNINHSDNVPAVPWSVAEWVHWCGIVSAGLAIAVLAIRVKHFVNVEDWYFQRKYGKFPENPNVLDPMQAVQEQVVMSIPTVTLIFFGVLLIEHIQLSWILNVTGLRWLARRVRRL